MSGSGEADGVEPTQSQMSARASSAPKTEEEILAVWIGGATPNDGVVVIHHDLWLNPDTTRGPDGKWLEARGPAIHELTFQELQQYDVGRLKPGTDYAKLFPDQQAVDGTRIPRLLPHF